MKNQISRREMFNRVGKVAGAAAVTPLLQTAILSCAAAEGSTALNTQAGIDRVTILPGKTYLRGWAGYGDDPRPERTAPWEHRQPEAPAPTGPAFAILWTKASGPGEVRFEDPKAAITTAKFSAPGDYVLQFSANSGEAKSISTLHVSVEQAPPVQQLEAVYTRNFKIDSKFWNARAKALIVEWIPHCIDVINSSHVILGPGGIDNFVEAGKKLRGEPAGFHKGYVFSNAWVHQTVEAMSIALMIDPAGDPEIAIAHERFRATLDDWIPKILAAQEPSGCLQTAFTLDRQDSNGRITESSKFKHWDPAHRGDHEGYTAGYFLESAINHYLMSGKKDARMYRAARKLADCWADHLGPAPKQPWYDGHQEMEQALVRFGRFVNDMEGGGKGDRYIQTAKFLLDCRYTAAADPARDRHEYDQSHLPVVQQYEAVGHAVRATYTYSGMADVAVETHDPDYQSAVKSLWDNVVNRKYYLTGGIGSGETSEGFGPNYSLRNNAYCESCSSCGMIFFHWKMNLAYHDARYVDNYEETMYNALLGSLELDGLNYYYTNPLDANMGRSSWHTCPCCVGNIPRTLLMVPTWAYATAPDGIYVNLYIGSTVTLERAAGTQVEMVQKTDYPWNGKIALTVNPQTEQSFALRLRIPNRTTSKLYKPAPEVNGLVSLTVNGKPVKPVIQKGYAVIQRRWKAGDQVELELPLHVQRVKAVEQIAATRGKVALRYGPLIYNIEKVDGDIARALADGTPLTAEWRPDLLGGVTVITGQFADGSKLLAIPNFARLNREHDLPPEAGPISASPDLYMGPNARPPEPVPTGTRRRGPLPPASIIWMEQA
ncbi:MAG TPA: beta-L-arabinofuranosidase domain-containing protein [Bryobacteraceae bacterium]|nr:beta-L-arabinofuranosidase domain-containing protein [Bryobacteraceae bacterium]